MNNSLKIDYSNLSIEQIDAALTALPVSVKSCILSASDAEEIKVSLMTAKENKILETYPIRIWQAENGVFRAHVYDENAPKKRRTVQGKDRAHLEKNILKDYYKYHDDRLIFGNYFVNWLMKYKVMYVKAPTIQRNYDDYRRFIQGTFLDKMKITEIKRLDLKRFYNEAINEHHITRHCLNNLKSIVNGVFAYAYDAEDISHNPSLNLKIENTNIKPERLREDDDEVFNEEELDALHELMYQTYLDYYPVPTLAILLNFQLGLRVSELCCIKKDCINLYRHTVRIENMDRSYRPMELIDGQVVMHRTIHEVAEGETKQNSNRILSLTDEAVAIIKEVLRLQQESGITSEYLFTDETGAHIIRQRINDCLRFYCKKLEIDVKSSHKIRKTVLSNLFAKNFDLFEVMSMAGHRDRNTTLKHYLFSIRMKSDKQERLSRALSSNHCPFNKEETPQNVVNPKLIKFNPGIKAQKNTQTQGLRVLF